MEQGEDKLKINSDIAQSEIFKYKTYFPFDILERCMMSNIFRESGQQKFICGKIIRKFSSENLKKLYEEIVNIFCLYAIFQVALFFTNRSPIKIICCLKFINFGEHFIVKNINCLLLRKSSLFTKISLPGVWKTFFFIVPQTFDLFYGLFKKIFCRIKSQKIVHFQMSPRQFS